MAGFHTKTFIKHDDYMSQKYVWDNIKHFIPNDKVIWECFYGDGKSGQYLKELGFNVIHEPIDFFDNNLGEVLVSNLPFSIKKECYTRLKQLDKPFIMISPSPMIHTSYIRNLFKDSKNPLQIIIPRKRMQFLKDGEEPNNKCNFDCFYYCYKMNLPKDIIWLE